MSQAEQLPGADLVEPTHPDTPKSPDTLKENGSAADPTATTNTTTPGHQDLQSLFSHAVHSPSALPTAETSSQLHLPTDLCEDGYLLLDHVPFAEEFDRDSPFYHGGNETPVPFDNMRIPQNMATVYAEEDSRLRELVKMRENSENDPTCVVMEQAVAGYHSLKKAWSGVCDAVLFRAAQVEAGGKSVAKMDSVKGDGTKGGGAGVLLNAKVKGLLQEATLLEANLSKNEFFRGYETETAKMREYLTTTLATLTISEAKKETKKRIEKLSKHFLTLQNSMIATVKAHKHSLNPSLAPAISSVLSTTQTPVLQPTPATTGCEDMCEKPGPDPVEIPSPDAPRNEQTMQAVLRR